MTFSLSLNRHEIYVHIASMYVKSCTFLIHTLDAEMWFV